MVGPLTASSTTIFRHCSTSRIGWRRSCHALEVPRAGSLPRSGAAWRKRKFIDNGGYVQRVRARLWMALENLLDVVDQVIADRFVRTIRRVEEVSLVDLDRSPDDDVVLAGEEVGGHIDLASAAEEINQPGGISQDGGKASRR